MRQRETTMVSDQDIAEALECLLRQTNPSSTTFTSFNSVVHHLESKLGLDLTSKLDFIQNQIHLLLLRSHPPPPPLPLQKPISPPPKPYFPPTPAFRRRPNPPPPLLLTPPLPNPPKSRPFGCSQTGKKRRGGPGRLNKLCGVSPELQAIVRHPALPRTEIVKQLWFYIRKNNIQDASNKRKIICNDELRLVFETDCTDMFKMNKLLAKHIITLEPTKPVSQNSKKPKVEVESETKKC
ncbi:hypothetical protein TEA_012759 [Camellia sinensis var. sinensis]|uniref:DM2 domain-containing protein n=1 Tax=Camellia sinensis var. sinensis TaxID=542762 RepID=A0A4S4DZZ3_CAMSN|nr:hypothetical protein TEA_012759 [Camellia sinensis var. sinensis]